MTSFPFFWKIIFTKKQEKTTCVVDILVLIVFFVVPLAEKLSWYSGMICNGFIYSEKNIRGLGRVLKKRYVGLICGTWNYWVGQSAQGSYQVTDGLLLVISPAVSHYLNSCLNSRDTHRAHRLQAAFATSRNLQIILHLRVSAEAYVSPLWICDPA